MNDITQTLIRAVLKIGGGYFISRGIMTDSTGEIIGAGIVAFIGVVWGYLHRTPDTQVPKLPSHPLLLLGACALLGASLSGCTTAKSGTAGGLLTIETNYLPRVHMFTNETVVTNTVIVTNTVTLVITNTTREIIVTPAPQPITNITLLTTNIILVVTNQATSMEVSTTNVTIFVTNQVTVTNVNTSAVTNQEPASVRVAPNPVVTGVAAAAGAAFPPWGTIGAVALAGILGGIATWRQKQINTSLGQEAAASDQVNALLVQGVEVAREILKTTPQGQGIEEKYTAWLKSHQDAAGLIEIVRQIVENNVDNKAAQDAAKLLAPKPTA